MNTDDRLEQASAEVRRQVGRIPLPVIHAGQMIRRRAAVFAVVVGMTALVGVTAWLTLPWSPSSPATSEPASPSTATSIGAPASSSTSTSATTTAPQTTNPSLLPDVPEVATGWDLEPGDVLVANGEGVHLVRAGELVGTLVTTPTEVALADGTGGLVLVIPDAELYPEHWPDLFVRGGRTLWRIGPDGSAEAIHEAATAEQRTLAPLSLYDVTVVAPLSPVPSLIFTQYQAVTPYVTMDHLMVLPLDGFSPPVLIPAETPGEGGVTGVGWQPAEGRFLMSTASDGGLWFSAWDHAGIELDWPTNPARQADPELAHHTSLTVVPGSSLIAYISSPESPEQSPSDLVIYDTAAGQEMARVQVTDPGTYVKFLHADSETVAISCITWSSETGYMYLPVLLFDLPTQSLRELQVAGMATMAATYGNSEPHT